MRIGIEARKLFSANKHGMDVVALELVRNIPLIDPENEYIVFAQTGPDKLDLPSAPNLKIVELPVAPIPGWEQFILPMSVASHSCDLLHCTGNTGPMKLSVPLVLTLHDIVYLENIRAIKNSSNVYQKLKNHYCRFVVPKIVASAKKLITVSKFQEKVLQTHLSIPASKISIIYNGVSDHFNGTCDADSVHRLEQKYSLPSNFILFLGSSDPKKNTDRVIQAYKHYCNSSETPLPLVVADFSRKKMDRLLNELNAQNIREHIILTGYIPNTELPYLYSLATLFLYPSMKESFGIPILEAMSCGTPVITSDTSSMPEVAENAAYIVDPFDAYSIAKAISLILQHDMLRDGLIKKGREQVKKFSFQKMAKEVAEVYKEVLGAE